MTAHVDDRAAELRVGLRHEEERELSEDDVLTFARLSGDVNPLHVHAGYAAGTTFGKRIVHGALQLSLASALLGTRLPGMRVLLGSVNARFPAPLFYPCRVLVTGEVTAWNPDSRAGQLRVSIHEAATRTQTADIGFGFTLHGAASALSAIPSPSPRVSGGGSRPLVAVTGASGDLGAAIVASLVADHDVVAIVNQHTLPAQARSDAVTELSLDLAHDDVRTPLGALLGDRALYGVVHAAWPGAPHGGLLEADAELLQRQLRFGSEICIVLAKVLFDRADAAGGRFVAISSTAGSIEPQLSQAAYSLGKACLDQTVRLLAPELARRKITINAIAPSFMRLGMNRSTDERMAARAAANVPAGRLCGVDDVASMVRFLLSAEASFMSGRILSLTGGKL